MPQVPSERAGHDDVALPPTDPALQAVLPKPPVDRPAHPDLQQIGQYRILGKIGEGGMGVVYKAEQREPVRRVVALKVIKLGMDSREVVARFEAERQALALMSHPNVAKVFEAGMTEAGRLYFAMELVPGIPVTRFCDDERLTIRQRLELFLPICQAVQHAHQKGIIHRDLKPSNVLVQLIDGKPVPKVIDFGVAKATNQALTQHTLFTQSGTLVGTPEYMSPEQAMTGGLDVDTRTDVYSLGVILYELLTGALPLESRTLRNAGLEGMARLLKEAEPPKPSTRLSAGGTDDKHLDPLRKQIVRSRQSELSTLRRELRGDLDWIVLKAIERERSRRYETANGLAMDLQRHLHDEPVLARPPSTIYRFQKMVRRNRLKFVGATAFLLSLLIGLLMSSWLFVLESHARKRAVIAEREQSELRQQAQTAQANAQAEELSARQRAYASDVNLVQKALAMDNLGRARDLLNRQRPQRDQRDLRGWEWRYLWKQCRGDASFTLCTRGAPIWSLAVSHDGRLAAVVDNESAKVSVWDLQVRREVAALDTGAQTPRVAFSPTQPLLAFTRVTPSGTWDLCLWDTSTRTMVLEAPLESEVAGLVFSADGQKLAGSLTAPGNQIVVWGVPKGTILSRLRLPAVYDRNAVSFAADAHLNVAACMSEVNLQVVDLVAGKALWTTEPLTDFVTAVAISPDGRTLALGEGYSASPIRLFDVPSGKELGRLEGHRGWISQLVFWPDGTKLASAGSDQAICLWDLTSRQRLATLHGHTLEVWRLALLPDNRTLISGSKDGSVLLWDSTLAGAEPSHVTVAGRVANFCFTPDSRSIVVANRDGRVDYRTGAAFRTIEPLFDIQAPVAAASILYERRRLAVGLFDGSVQFWDLDRRQMLGGASLGPAGGKVPFAIQLTNDWIFAPQRDRLTYGLRNTDSLHQWNPLTGNEESSLRGYYSAAAFSPDARWLFAVGWSGNAVLHDLISGRETPANLDIREVNGAAISPDGSVIACASERGYAKFWTVPTLHEVGAFRGFLQGVHSVAFSGDGRRLAIGSGTREAVKLWDLESRQEVLTLEGEGSILDRTAFSPDGSIIAAMSRRGILELWRAPTWAQIEMAESN